MRLIPIIFISLIAFTNTTRAKDKNQWLEVYAGGGGNWLNSQLNFKSGDNDTNWAIELGRYDDFKILSHIKNRETGEIIDANVSTLGLTKNWNNIQKWGYTEAGIGLGAAKGTWAKDCVRVKSSNPGFFFSSEHDSCDIIEGVRLGVPLHASAVFGKYLGIGITIKAFVTTEDIHGSVGLTIPFGNFTQ